MSISIEGDIKIFITFVKDCNSEYKWSKFMKDSQTNKVFFSGQLTDKDSHCFKEIKTTLKNYGIEYGTIYNTNDIWARDYMPIQIEPGVFVRYIYNPDYLCSPALKDYITETVGNKGYKCSALKNAKLIDCDLILDGGNVVICGDKIILTDKIFLENRLKSRQEVIHELDRVFGKTIVIIPSDPYEIEHCRNNHELPLCHADGVLAAIDDESILIADYGPDPKGYVKRLKESLEPYFGANKIQQLDFGDNYSDNSWVYINFLRVGDVVLLPVLGGKEAICDKLAEEQLREKLNVRTVVPINTRYLTLDNKENNGGSLHCISWNVRVEQ